VKFRPLAFGAAIGASVLLAACSSSSSGGAASTGSASAAAAGTAASSAAGSSTGSVVLPAEKIGIVGASNQSTIVVRYENDVEAAAKVLGWSTVVDDGNNTPSTWDNELQNLVTQHVSAILTVGVDATTAETQLQAAKAANIPVIAVGVTVNPQEQSLFAGAYEDSSNDLGDALATYILKKDPKAGIVAQNLTVAYSASQLIAGFEKALTTGGGTVLATQDDAGANPTQSFSASAVSLVRAHPNAAFIVGCCDFTSAIDLPALQQANLTQHVTIAEAYDDPITLQQIRAGEPVITVAVNNEQPIVDAMGALAAYFANKTPIPATDTTYQPQAKVVDKSNVPSSGNVYSFDDMLNAAATKWRAEYKIS